MGRQTGNERGRFIATLEGQAAQPPPIWLMRQAGRYLPEYRAVREKAGSFLDLCFNPDLAAEVTLQPVRRFDLDAAIIFADILLLPHALGQPLTFAEGEGPRLSPPVDVDVLKSMQDAGDVGRRLAPVFETIARVRAALSSDKAMIGFAGAPWTVATYMLSGGPHSDPSSLRRTFYDQPEFVAALIDLLVDETAAYLSSQISAGADAVQLFDSWAGGLPPDVLDAVSVRPLGEIARRVKEKHPGTPVILFPKGVGAAIGAYAHLAGVDAISIDHALPWDFARETLSPHVVVQGGLDPMLVVRGGKAMEAAARRLCETFRGVPYIFNLGHGLTPDTPPDNVARLVEIVRQG